MTNSKDGDYYLKLLIHPAFGSPALLTVNTWPAGAFPPTVTEEKWDQSNSRDSGKFSFLYFKVYLRKIQGKSEKSVNAQSFKSHVKPVPTLPSILRILSSTYIGHLIPHSYQLIGWPFARESGSRIGLCWKILGYTIWTLAQWSNEGCIVCESGLFFCLTASPSSGMCLAFDQKQHLHTWSVRSHRSSFVLFWRHYLKNTYFLHETQEHFFVSCLQIFDWLKTNSVNELNPIVAAKNKTVGHTCGASMHPQLKATFEYCIHYVHE